MLNSRKKIKLKLIVLVFLGIFITNYELYPLVSSSSSYTLSLDKGSQIFEVSYYDKEAWKENINDSSNPTDWFRGESDTIGAKSKATVLVVHDGGDGTLGMFGDLFFNWFEINRSILWQYGYYQSFIDSNYPNNYNLWRPFFTFWPFGTEPFDNYDNSFLSIHIIRYNVLKT